MVNWPNEENPLTYDARLLPQSPAEFAFIFLLRSTQSSHDAQHDLVLTLASEAARLDEKSVEDVAARMVGDLKVPEETKSAVKEMFDKLDAGAQASAQARFGEEEPDLAAFLTDPTAYIYESIDIPARLGEWIGSALPIVAMPNAVPYLRAYSMALSALPRDLLFLKAGLIAIVGDFEVRLRRIVFRYLEVSTPEVSATGRSAEVRRIFGGGLPDWADKLESRHGLEIRSLAADWPAIVEIMARRHAHVHQGGFVDNSYREATGSTEPNGMPLPISAEYLDTAIDLLIGFALTILATAWTKVVPELEAAVASVLVHDLNDLLHRGCFRLALDEARIGERLDTSEQRLAQTKVNRLLAERALYGNEAIAPECETWDTSDLPEDFEMARLILLARDAAARVLFDQLRASGDIDDYDLRTWFLFEGWKELEGD